MCLRSTFGRGKLKVNFNYNDDGKVFGFTATEYDADEDNEIKGFLDKVINCEENIKTSKIITKHNKIDDTEWNAGMELYNKFFSKQ